MNRALPLTMLMGALATLAVAQPQFLTSSPLPTASPTAAYQTVVQTNSATPVSCSVIGGSLPPSFSVLSSSNNCIVTSGSTTSLAPGLYTFTLQATNAQPGSGSRLYQLSIFGHLTPADGVTGGVLGTPYNFNFQAAGCINCQWSINGGQPPGLTLSNGGVLSGTPTQQGTFNFSVTVTDSSQGFTHQRAFFMTVTAGGGSGFQFTTTSPLQSGFVGVNYGTVFVNTSGGNGNLTGCNHGTLPAGLNVGISGTSCTISGVPTQAGTVQFLLQAVDSANQTSQAMTYSITINSSGGGGIFQFTTSSPLPSGFVGQNYGTIFVNTSGGNGNLIACNHGNLPAGLNVGISGTSCTISGVPTQAGQVQFVMQAVDSANQASQTMTYSITINGSGSGGFQFTTSSPLPNGFVGSNYQVFLNTTGGTGNLINCSHGSLPDGLFMDVSGTACRISGVPTTQGTSLFAVQAFDQNNQPSQGKQYQITITGSGGGGSFQITTTSLPDAAINQNYTAFIQTINGAGNVTSCDYSIGSLPPGLFIQPSNTSCAVTGTPTSFGSYQFNIRAFDQNNNVTPTVSLFINVTNTGGGGGGGLQIITNSPVPSGALGLNYAPNGTTFFFQATGGSGNYFWSISNSTVPPGLALGTDGSLTGIPTQIGTYSFDVQVTSQSPSSSGNLTAVKTFQMAISSGRLRIVEATTTPTLPFGINGNSYFFTFHADGGTSPYTWSLGSISPSPLNLSLDPNTGSLSGTPQTSGTFQIPVTLRDSSGTFVSFAFSLFIAAPLSILNDSFPDGAPGVNYNQTLRPGGGQGPYRWFVSNGSLPPGLALNTTSGVISGVPTSNGRFSFTIRLTDSGERTATKDFTITIGLPIQITTSSPLPDGAVTVPYSQTLQASGGSGSYTWTASGTLPDGLSLGSSGTISGTPTAPGSFTFTVTARDSQGSTGQKAFTINVVNPVVITTTQTQIPDGLRGTSYLVGFGANGGTSPYAWSILSGALPDGLNINAATGIVIGTPTRSGSFGFVVQVKDILGQAASKAFVININEPLAITTTSLTAPFGVAFSQQLAASGGSAPLTWELIGGALPAGLGFSSNGTISGTPTVSGTVTLTFRVSDSKGQTDSRAVAITVTLPPLPGVTVRAVNSNGSAPGPNQQVPLTLTLGSTFPADANGTLTLTFQPLVGFDDPNVRFGNGLRTLNFVVRQGQTAASFPSLPGGGIVMTGTVAGTITITLSSATAAGSDVTPTPVVVQRYTIDAGAPVITGVQLQQTAGGVNVIVTGYSTSREVTSGTFRFAAATGSTLQTSDFTVQFGTTFSSWFTNPASAATGSQFTLTMPFTVSGSSTSIISVSVQLANSRGNSNTATP